MSGAPSSTRRPQSVVHLPSRSSAREASSGSSYRASRENALAQMLVVDSSQHTDPREILIRNKSRWIAPTDCETQGEGSSNVRWTLNHSTEVESRAEDNERIISELRREVEDLK
jgi:hypothetical protein